MLQLNKGVIDRISYGIIGVIIFTALLPILGVYDGLVTLFQYVFLFSLVVFYILVSDKKDLFFYTLILFALQILSLIGFNISNGLIYNVSFKIYCCVSVISNIFAAAALMIRLYQQKKESQNIELLEVLLVVILLLPLWLLVLRSVNVNLTDYSIYLYLCICAVIIMLMCKRKVWMLYTKNKKNLLMYLLVVSFIELIKYLRLI